MTPETISPAVVTSNTADKHLNETIKPALTDITTSMQEQASQTPAEVQTATTSATTQAPGTSTTASTAPLSTFSYIATDGTSKTVQGANPQEAMSKAPDIAAHSGVQLMPSVQAPVETVATETPVETPSPYSQENALISGANKKLETAEAEYQTQADNVQKTIAKIQSGAIPLNAGEKAQVSALQNAFKELIENQKLSNKGASGLANIRGYQRGSAEYDPTFQLKTIGSIVNKGNQLVSDLNVKMAGAVASLTQGFKDSNIAKVKDSWNIYQDASNKRTEAIEKTIASTQAAIKSAQDAFQKQQDKITDIAKSAAESGADQETLASILNSGSVSEAVYNAGDSLQKGTGVVGEYLFYKKEAIRNGQVPLNFNEYADMDANRKRSITNIGIGGDSGYTPKQISTITRINDSLSKNATYSKTNSMRNYIDNVKASLSQGTGVGDIAAINQFQKVIDEGAVTRDQDVKLIQGAQSLSSQLQLKVKKLEKGDQLAQVQRDQIRKLVDDMYVSQLKALEKDPYVAAKKKEAELNGIAPDDTILSELKGFGGTGGGIIQSEEQAQDKLVSLALNDPNIESIVVSLAGKVQPDLGRAYTWQEIAEIAGVQ